MDGPVDHSVAPPAPAPAKGGPIDNHDVDDWKNRFNHVLGNAGEVINSKSSGDAQEWSSGFFGCCNPIDTCKSICTQDSRFELTRLKGLLTYCCPCVTFGKIHHRYKKNGSLEGYEPINTSVSPTMLCSIGGYLKLRFELADTFVTVPSLRCRCLRRSPLHSRGHAAL